MKYKVINQRVEINGTLREIGAVVDASEFRPLPSNRQNTDAKKDDYELSELESLLTTKHVEPISGS